ncbi:amino acid transporter [Xenococcus sp. PCC 7305]|uniref:amino acid permease n=1 Tax=Xenococcus sp. PCC 7305 TaxID=102125 RepID=UPI0002AC6794|nr:amino acid permease [Xenococcus sp. PCC 7305]ELS00947.1 amino acid transporter [Xenococcus sp. PCC 7305]
MNRLLYPGSQNSKVFEPIFDSSEYMKTRNPRKRIIDIFRQTNSVKPKLYNSFEGVFKPTLLTILGAIMYLRVGWVVGNAGLLGGMLIILAALSITFATGLSLSSIASNTRLEAGGPYAMIAKALGLEVGGAIGIPLFLSQAFAVAMYIFGFREGWLRIFPQHPALIVDLSVFLLVLAIASISARLAFRIQYLVMALVIISLVSIFASPNFWTSQQPLVLIGEFPGSAAQEGISFWGVFAVFFPAVTGIMSGVNMSGELQNSRKNIPIGTLSAIGVSSIVYLALCWWASRVDSPAELVKNYTIMIDQAFWKPAVLAGLLAATFSAALSSIVGAPRILVALARDEVIPQGRWIGKLGANGEPRRGIFLTSLFVLAALMIRDLNAIASLITMFFLITYATLNLVVLLESQLGLMNFRPTFKIPQLIPLYGFASCLFAMLVIDARFSFIAIAIVLFIYFQLVKKPDNPRVTGDVRSGIFEAIAQWAAKKVIEIDINNFRAWRPILLVPIEDSSQLLGQFRLLLDISQPEGSIQLLGLAQSPSVRDFAHRLQKLAAAFRRRSIFTTFSILKVTTYIDGILAVLQSSQNTFFRPNILCLKAPKLPTDWEVMQPLLAEAQQLEIGIMLLGLHPLAGMGRVEVINLWLTPQLGEIPLSEKLKKGNLNLTMLMALRLYRSWQGSLNLITVVNSNEEVPMARQYIEELRDLCRIPNQATTFVLVGEFNSCIIHAPQSDMDFIGLPKQPNFDFICRMIDLTGSSCLFFRDSGNESAIA